MPDGTVPICLSTNEAVVLFEFLTRNGQSEELRFEDEAERTVLADLLCALERHLSVPFDPNYSQLLAEARQSLRRSA